MNEFFIVFSVYLFTYLFVYYYYYDYYYYYYLFIYLFIYFFFGGGGGVLSSNAFTIWCCIPISRPPRVFRRFSRRSC